MVKRKVVTMESSKNLDVAPQSQRKRRKHRHHPTPDNGAGAISDSDPPPPPSSPGSVRRLLEPYSRPRLVSILAEAAAGDPALRARLRAAANASLSHRRLFVHGLPPRADSSALADAFSGFGSLEECSAVADRAGRCKGYGFVTFTSRAAARRALLLVPGITVAGSPVSTQFATAGPTGSSASGSGGGGGAGRRVYVTNVAPDADPDRLRAFFARFGELDGGPFGFDAGTGRSRGYALFVYRAAAGAAAAVEEPYRVFEGRALHCQLANEPARRSKAPTPAAARSSASTTPPSPPAAAAPAVEAPALQPVLDAVVAAGVGDLAACARNPAQAAALLGQNPVLAAAVLSSALVSAEAARGAAAASAIAPSPAAASAPIPITVNSPSAPMPVAAEVPSPVKFGVRPNGGAGLLGPYKPPSSTAVSSSSGKKGTMVGT